MRAAITAKIAVVTGLFIMNEYKPYPLITAHKIIRIPVIITQLLHDQVLSLYLITSDIDYFTLFFVTLFFLPKN